MEARSLDIYSPKPLGSLRSLIPEFSDFDLWTKKVLSLEALDVPKPVQKERALSPTDLIRIIKNARREIQNDGWRGEFSSIEKDSLNGVSGELMREVHELIHEHGVIISQESREALCSAVERKMNSFFRRKGKVRKGSAKALRSRNAHLKNLARGVQIGIGQGIDESHDFTESRYSLTPYVSVRIDIDKLLGAFDLDTEGMTVISYLTRLQKHIEEKFSTLDIQLILDDVFENPERYPVFYSSLGVNGTLKSVRDLYAHVVALNNLIDYGIPAYIESIRSQMGTSSLRIVDESTAAYGGSVREVVSVALNLSDTSEYSDVTLGDAANDNIYYNFEGSYDLNPWVATLDESLEEEVESTEYTVTRTDINKLVRYVFRKRSNPTQIVYNLNKYSTGSFVWKHEHLLVPAELSAFAELVYNDPKAQGNNLAFMSHYVNLWIENASEADLASFHPEVRASLLEWDSYEASPDGLDLSLEVELPWDKPEPVRVEVSAAVEDVLDESPKYPITMRDMARLLRMMVWERDTLTSRMVINMNSRGAREGDWKWTAEHFRVPEQLRVFMKAVYEHPRAKGGIRHLQFYMALWLESYMHWFKDEFHPDVYSALESGVIDSGLELNDQWADDENPKSGFSEFNLMAIESDLPWPK